MISPAPQPQVTLEPDSTDDIAIARGIVESLRNSVLILAVPGTDYRLHLQVAGDTRTMTTGRPIRGVIRANARRIDITNQGGGIIDPVYGRPRDIQGRVKGIVPGENSLVIRTAVPMVIRVRAPQQLSDFQDGQMVMFSVDRGANFTPVQP